MRRALLRELPAFSHFYGLQPWQVIAGTVEALTYDEIDEYRRQLPKAPKATKRRR